MLLLYIQYHLMYDVCKVIVCFFVFHAAQVVTSPIVTVRFFRPPGPFSTPFLPYGSSGSVRILW